MQKHKNNTIHDIFSNYFEGDTIQRAAYFVSKKLEEGHICLDINDHNKHEDEFLDLEKINSSPFVSTKKLDNIQPFILLNDKLYLHRYFRYETIILDKITELVKTGNNLHEERKENLEKIKTIIINTFQNESETELDINWQLIASLNALLNNFTIITGGPGTGKTTVITKFLSLLYLLNPNVSLALAAPTGKAAARLNESITNTISSLSNIPIEIKEKFQSLNTQTIHRLLGVQYNSPYFVHNKDNLLKYDVIIIDESSMIDAALMAKLLDSISSESRLIMLGDKNQLASIEAGSIFGDLCKSQNNNIVFSENDINFYNKFIEQTNSKLSTDYINNSTNWVAQNIIELKKSYRFKNDEGIGRFSSLVIEGITDKTQLIEPFKNCNNDIQCVKLIEDYSSKEIKEMLKLYEEYAKESDIKTALLKLNNIKILCAVKEGEYGVKNYNKIVENHLKSKSLLNPSLGFYDKQAIMISSNDYSTGLFNGDIGVIRKNTKTNILHAYFIIDDKLKEFPLININKYETVFAMTIHKSQGSEFKNICIILPKDSNHQLLSRELLYTAVTRAKEKVLIVGNDEVLINAVNRQIKRISGIGNRL